MRASKAPSRSLVVMNSLKRLMTMAKKNPWADRCPSKFRDMIPPYPNRVPQLLLLGCQVVSVFRNRLDFQGDALHDAKPVSLEAHDLAGIVGEEAHLAHPEID